QTLLEYAEKWKTSEDPLPLLEVYTVAIRSYVKARPYLTSECENVALVLERLALSCVELLLCLPVELSDKQWEQFQTLVQVAHEKLMENGSCELQFLATLAQETGVWKNPVLCTILSQEPLDQDKVNEFLAFEGPILLDMRIKHLIKTNQLSQATALAKLCSDHPEIGTKGSLKQTYLVCLCTSSPNEKLIEEISEVDCKDALEMICNLESEGDEKNAPLVCTAFLSRQLQQGDMYCAWELTLFWSKLQQRVEPSVQVYLERCRQLSLLTKTVYHIFFLIKVINSETEGAGLATCIELCVKALRLDATENTEVKISICKTISCLLPDDLEVKRACQLSEFLIEPTVDAYYAVEMLYNQPDQKYDEENLPIPNSLRCELLLVLKTQWPFDPEFWDWKTLKRQCLALMGEEASIVSSIDELNDSEVYEKVVDYQEENKEPSVNGLSGGVGANSGHLKDTGDEKQKKKEIKQLRERGFISARFRNWQAYMQYCVLCDKEFLGHRIVRHAQKHYKDGVYSCPICAKNFNSKETFVPHVTLHVKQSSKERLAAMKPLRRLGRPPKITTTHENQKTNTVTKQEQRPIKKNSLYSTDFIVFNDNDGSDDENDDKDKSYEPEVIPVQKPVPVNEFNCPVTFCKKGFKYFKNLIAHVKGHKDNEDAKRFLEMQSKKVICQYCRRHFVSVTHLNDHLQMHCGSKPYICIQMKCKAGFNSYAELLTHRKEHQVFRARCMFPKCGRIFSEAYLLYDHEAQHYNTYTCKFIGCGKVYRSQSELEKHLDDHSTPEKVLPPEDHLNSSGDSVQSSIVNQNTGEKTEKEKSMLPSENNIENGIPADRSDAWDKSKSESAVTKQDQVSASELRQANGSLSNGLENPATTTPLLQASEVAVSIKVSLNQGIEDNFGKQENSTVEGAGQPLITNLNTPVEDTCNNVCHPSFHEKKEQDCFNEAQISQNSLVNSETLKIGELNPQNLGHVNSLMTFSVQSDAEFQNSLPASKYECGNNVKVSSSLYNLPLKTLESITFVPSQPNLSSSLGTPSVPPKAPAQKFSCQVEGCTRTYNSSQSIGKHMKTAHPDQYAAFKVQRKSKKEVEEESEVGKESEETETKQTMKEFRCQVSDCSRIFQAITGLIQHYMKLHEMTPEEIESMTASVDVGKFPCDQLECKSSFTTYLNYVVHLEADHGIGARASKTEEDGIYKCDCEGCDRIYATRSNLLRHIFNKHNDKHKAHLIRPRKLTPGQENISSKANQEKSKSKQRGAKHSRTGKEGIKMPATKRKKKCLENKNAKIVQIEENKPYSLKRGKHVYSIKARNDALSECTSRFVTQYPCMIKGCTSVVTSESNIIRHYKCHKLSKAFTSQHRNLLIVFKRCDNLEVKETSEQGGDKNDVKDSDTCISENNDNSRTTTVPQKEVEKNEKDEMDELTELFITKLINEDSTSMETQGNTSSNINNDFQESNPCQSERQKANNLKRVNKEKNLSQCKKRKVEKVEPELTVEINSLRKEEETAVAIQTTEEHPASFDWSSFKPMGFEASFLKFLEESAVKQKKNTDKDHTNSGTKRGSHSNSRKNTDKTAVTIANHICSCKESEIFVQFANPSQLQCSDNVKIVLDKTLKDCTELVLKQLQEMKPTVSLKKLEVHSNDPDMSVMKEMSVGKATGRGQY
ncbi:Zinc finger protein 292, partial [Heterocephalus glaber]